jgi:uridine kinase
MFKKAIEKFNIDPSVSYMIGDSERDIQAGVNAGCITIGVRQGYGIRKTRVYPDYMFNDLSEAVDFIVDEPYKDVLQKIRVQYSLKQNKGPFIILIGGNTRSGKSTLSSYLRLAFKKSGLNVLQMSLDNWLMPEERRTPSMNVYERFQIKKIEQDLNKLFSGEILSVSTYVNHIERIPLQMKYNPTRADVVIVEGVVALSSESIRNQASVKIFMDIEAPVFIKRMNDYYAWRGRTPDETAKLIKKREVDEYQLIEKESKLADLIINSSCS